MIPRGRPLHPAFLARPMAAIAVALALAGAGCAGGEPSRQLYQWTDGEGNVRYTPFPDRVPAARAHTRRVVEPGASAEQNAAGLPDARTATASPAPGVSAPRTPEEAAGLDARIAVLEARVAADEEALKTLISDPAKAGGLRDSEELREIARRLPGLQAELARLRAVRAEAGPQGGEAPAPAPEDASDGG